MADAADPPLNFSYAGPTDPWLKRFVIRAVERMTGQPYLKSLYDDFRAHPVAGRKLLGRGGAAAGTQDRLQRRRAGAPAQDAGRWWSWPIIPSACWTAWSSAIWWRGVRSDFLVLTNEVLTRAEEIKPWLLPIDFAETEAALATNLKSRAAAKHHLMNGGCLIVFPAGGVSTTPTLWHRQATDAEWKKFTARLITQSQGRGGAGVLRRAEQPAVPAGEPYLDDLAPFAAVQGNP